MVGPSRVRGWALLVGLGCCAAAGACERRGATSTSSTPADSAADGNRYRPNDSLESGTDASQSRLTALEDSLRRDSTGASAARWLWHLGRLMRRTRGTIAFGAPDTVFVVARREKYWSSEPDAQYVYNGRDYEDLVLRFPGDSLAAEASYALTFLDIAGECEGSVDCYLARDGGPLERFLRRYPASPHAADAVQRLTDVYVTVLEFAPQRGDIWDVDSARVSAQVFGVDSVITALPDALRAAGYARLIRVMNAWRRPERAREMSAWLASRRP